MNYKFDLGVIGGGAAGLFAVSIANALGAKVVLIEKNRLGGDCTWFGCIPSKAILKAAGVVNLINHARLFGISIKEPIINTDGALSYVEKVVEKISTHHPQELFERRGIKIIIGEPRFLNDETIEVKGEKIKAKKFIICTGSHPFILPIRGLLEIGYITNETIFSLNKLPQSLIVLGAGPIGVELSQALKRLGVKVSIVEMMDRILFHEDKEISSFLEKKLKEEGIEILTGKKAIEFGKEGNKVYAILEDNKKNKEKVLADNVLVAIGRSPNIEGLDLDKVGVKSSQKGIKVNAYLQTNNPSIFACGDVVGHYMFSHVASYQASICVRNALFRGIAWQKVNYSNIVWATFTDPEIAHLGLTEEEARNKGIGIKIYKTEYKSSDRAITDNEKGGLLKVITDKKGYILGAHIVGSNASEIMQGFIITKGLKQPLSKLATLLYIYPTLSELVKKTAAQALIDKANNPWIKFVIKLMRKK